MYILYLSTLSKVAEFPQNSYNSTVTNNRNYSENMLFGNMVFTMNFILFTTINIV